MPTRDLFKGGTIALLKYVEIDTRVLLERHRTALLAIACELEAKGKLTGDESQRWSHCTRRCGELSA